MLNFGSIRIAYGFYSQTLAAIIKNVTAITFQKDIPRR